MLELEPYLESVIEASAVSSWVFRRSILSFFATMDLSSVLDAAVVPATSPKSSDAVSFILFLRRGVRLSENNLLFNQSVAHVAGRWSLALSLFGYL